MIIDPEKDVSEDESSMDPSWLHKVTTGSGAAQPIKHDNPSYIIEIPKKIDKTNRTSINAKRFLKTSKQPIKAFVKNHLYF